MPNPLPLLTLLLFSWTAFAQQPSPIQFIYDASGSMWGQMDGRTKKEIAAEVLGSAVGKLPEEQQIGLIAYGHRSKGDCDDIELLVSLSNKSKSAITNAVGKLNPTGKTPLARSAEMAIQSLVESKTKATIILITDGIESCDGDICKVVTDAKAKGIEFKLHIVGFGLKDGEKEQLICAVQAGDGKYYDAADAGGLGDVLLEATTESVDKPIGNFSVFALKNGEPVDAWVKPIDARSGKVLFGARTYRDTAWMSLEAGSYTIQVTPLENSDIPGIQFPLEYSGTEKVHRDVSFDGGKLQVTVTNNGEPWDALVKMYDKTTGKVVASTRTYGRSQEMEVPAGSYRVTYAALSIEGMQVEAEVDPVEISPNRTLSVGHDFKSGIAMIGVQTASGERIDATVNVFDKVSGKNVAAGRTYTSENNNPRKFILNPGTYEVKIVTLGAHKGNASAFTLIVQENQTVEKTITY